ncbi:GFA family protein [Thalassomonas viridans]|uniref:GFA family protein n=1 Tax=Thalassomonas viridans TaxID=137584 RepID=A0AAE9Z0R2_9GAMM|nr:GFA family protein [Thalassomonas viridans]WDE03068.1 GFA family protein [Thalassomonas viridans]
MKKASCLCGAIKLQIDADPVKVSHCHCTMCQKQHGAAYATYARFRREDVDYLQGEDKLSVYNSSEDVLRKFCSVCGSNIEWGCSERFPQWVAIALAAFDNEFALGDIKELHLASKVCWLSKG